MALVNYDWVPEPVGFKMIVKPPPIEATTKGGIILVDESKQYADTATFCGEVVRQGPDCYRDKASRWCNVGDKVLYARHHGQAIKVKTPTGDWEKFVIINDDDVRTKLDDFGQVKMYLE